MFSSSCRPRSFTAGSPFFTLWSTGLCRFLATWQGCFSLWLSLLAVSGSSAFSTPFEMLLKRIHRWRSLRHCCLSHGGHQFCDTEVSNSHLGSDIPPGHWSQLASLFRSIHLHLVSRNLVENSCHLVADVHIRCSGPRPRHCEHVFHPSRHILRPPRHWRGFVHLEVDDSHCAW